MFIGQYVRGSAGSSFCDQLPNSSGQPGRLRALGSDVAAENRVTLAADRLPGEAFSLFVTGTAPSFVPGVGGGTGNLCVGGQLGRLNAPGQIRTSTADGRRSLELDLGALPGPVGDPPGHGG